MAKVPAFLLFNFSIKSVVDFLPNKIDENFFIFSTKILVSYIYIGVYSEKPELLRMQLYTT